MDNLLDYSPAVTQARAEHKPIVALESTLITHGLPYPTNLETAQELEAIVHANGAEPATIAIINGRIKIGLTADELSVLANSDHPIKASQRDLAAALSQRHIAGTTIAATLFCAHLADIRVLATGGLGGVHRDFQNTHDVSADLLALARTPIAVVNSGIKAILDTVRTYEHLETVSIPIIGYQTSTLPLFYIRDSQFTLDTHFDSLDEIAGLLKTHWQLNLPSGLLIVNPVPEANAIKTDQFEAWMVSAMQEAAAANITGKAITPYLLQRLFHLSDGKTLQTNIALLKDNARVGAKLAAHLADLDN